MSKDKFYHSKQNNNFKKVSADNETQLVAIDSNVFIDMSHEMNGERQNAKQLKNNFYNRMAIIRKKVLEGKIKLVITPTVFDEITKPHGLSKAEQKFIKDYCLILNPKDKPGFARKVRDLTNEYIRSGVMTRGKKKPYHDAMIMAEATISGLNLLTNNHKDFTIYETMLDDYKRDEYGDLIPKRHYKDEMLPKHTANLNENEFKDYLKIKGRFKALDINRINNGMGYTYVNKNGYKVTPTPFSTIDYIGKNNEMEGLCHSNQFVNNFNSKDFELTNYEAGK